MESFPKNDPQYLDKYDETALGVQIDQERIRSNLKTGPKPNLAFFRTQIENAIRKVIGDPSTEVTGAFNRQSRLLNKETDSNKAPLLAETAPSDNLWLNILPEHRMKARADLEKTCNSFFAEYLRSSDDTDFFFDEEKMRRITEYLLYQQENIKRDIKKQKNYTRLAAYNDYEFLDKFLHDDEFLAKQVGFSLEETREFFTDDVRKKLAINNISDPLDAVIRVKENYTKVLTDENIFTELNKDPNVQFEMEEVKELFTDGVRKYLAVKNISDPLDAVIRVKENYTKTLTHENIFTELNKDSDVTFDISEVKELFTGSVRKRLAVGNISDPLDAVIRVKENYAKTLTHENIFTELNKDPNVQFEMEEVKELFTDGVRKYLAVKNISDPLDAVIRVKENYTKTLTHENIFTELNKDSDVRFDISEVKELFTDGVRKYFAVGNIESPILGLCNFVTGKIASKKYNLKFSDNIKLAAEAYILKHSSKN